MALALISFILLVVNARKQHKPEELYVNRVAAAEAAKAEADGADGSGTESSEQTNNNEDGGN